MGSGSKFSDPTNPNVMVRVGDPGSSGVLEITDMVFKTRGPGASISFGCLAIGLTIVRFSWWSYCC